MITRKDSISLTVRVRPDIAPPKSTCIGHPLVTRERFAGRLRAARARGPAPFIAARLHKRSIAPSTNSGQGRPPGAPFPPSLRYEPRDRSITLRATYTS
ncbi:hypothetical protein EVAR_88276_1 [Eumeta japonica]|uniref:Uncharacterized protein n=1 Tax=Eumeta variegata TaxID=151549 RepID=A0A4C1XMJ5_EUMVA|nr:hypothetical protein EVAR_88276_1 [Eumeta japonica]